MTVEQVKAVCAELGIERPVIDNEVNRRKLLTRNVIINIDGELNKMLFGDAYAAYVLYSVYASKGMRSLMDLIRLTNTFYISKCGGLSILKSRSLRADSTMDVTKMLVTVIGAKIDVNEGTLEHVYTNLVNIQMTHNDIPVSLFFKEEYSARPSKFILVDKILGRVDTFKLRSIDYLAFLSHMMLVDDNGYVYRITIEDPVNRDGDGIHKFLEHLFNGWKESFGRISSVYDHHITKTITMPKEVCDKYGVKNTMVTFEGKRFTNLTTDVVKEFITNLETKETSSVETKIVKNNKKNNIINYKLINKILKDKLREDLSSFVTTMNIVSTEYSVEYEVDKKNNLLLAVAISKDVKEGILNNEKIIYRKVEEYSCKYNNIKELLYLCRELGIKEV